MKKLIVIGLVISSLAMAMFADAASKHARKDTLSQAFSDKNQSDTQNDVGFSLSMKHVDPGKPVIPGSIRAVQIFPINTVTGGLTYTFS